MLLLYLKFQYNLLGAIPYDFIPTQLDFSTEPKLGLRLSVPKIEGGGGTGKGERQRGI